MHRFLYNVVAHMYYAHCARLRQLDMHRHLNTVFRHFTYLTRDFSLLELHETSSLDDLVGAMGLYSSSELGTSSTSSTGHTDGKSRKNNGSVTDSKLSSHKVSSSA